MVCVLRGGVSKGLSRARGGEEGLGRRAEGIKCVCVCAPCGGGGFGVGWGRVLFVLGQGLMGKGQIGEGLGRGWGLRKKELNRVHKILRGEHRGGSPRRGAQGYGRGLCEGRGLICKLH